MPPVLDPSKSKVDGLAFLGLSLSRKSDVGHPKSLTHQTAFDLNDVLDRDYEHVHATNDDGWLVGGGEPGPPISYKLAAADSSHVEIMRIGTYRPDWGGIKVEAIVDAISEGRILIPNIIVVPTAVIANPDKPPELEIRFDMDPPIEDVWKKLQHQHQRNKNGTSKDGESYPELPVNWQLRFIHNQLFRYFIFPSRFCPGPFHSTILRKAEFYSPHAERAYFAKCKNAVEKWRAAGPKALVPASINPSIEKVAYKNKETKEDDAVKDEKKEEPSAASDGVLVDQAARRRVLSSESADHQSGIWLFTDRDNITHWFAPNFLPPYDTPEKMSIILEFLKDEWDEPTRSWKPIGKKAPGKKPAKGEAPTPESPTRASKNGKGGTTSTSNAARDKIATVEKNGEDGITESKEDGMWSKFANACWLLKD